MLEMLDIGLSSVFELVEEKTLDNVGYYDFYNDTICVAYDDSDHLIESDGRTIGERLDMFGGVKYYIPCDDASSAEWDKEGTYLYSKATEICNRKGYSEILVLCEGYDTVAIDVIELT